MPVRKASAEWTGTLREGKGAMKLGSGAFEGPFSFGTRFEEVPWHESRRIDRAAHAGCFSMAFSADLGRAGFTPDFVRTTSTVHLATGEGGARINKIELNMEAKVPGIDAAKFQEIAAGTKNNCPVSKALAAVDEIVLNAKLVK